MFNLIPNPEPAYCRGPPRIAFCPRLPPRWCGKACRQPFALCFQKLQQELEFLEVQEEYIKDEQKNLKKEFLHAQEEVKRIQSIPLVIGQFLEAVDQNTAIVGSTTGEWGGRWENLPGSSVCPTPDSSMGQEMGIVLY